MLRRLAAFAAVFAATLALSGCFVISTNLPAGFGNVADPHLVGAWRGVDADDGKDSDAFLHFQMPNPDKPLHLVWVEDKGYQLYEVRTAVIGKRNVFAAMLLGPQEALKDGDMQRGWFIGFYEYEGADRVTFWLFDSKKVGDLIAKGRLKGTRKPGQWEMATLTGSPQELAAFLASPDAQAARIDEPAKLRRLTQAPQ